MAAGCYGEREPQFIDGEGEGEEGEEEARNKKKSRDCENNFSFVREYGIKEEALNAFSKAKNVEQCRGKGRVNPGKHGNTHCFNCNHSGCNVTWILKIPANPGRFIAHFNFNFPHWSEESNIIFLHIIAAWVVRQAEGRCQ